MALVSISLSLAAPAVRAGMVQRPPSWIPFEMDAINLCRSGMNQESSDPQGALKTLQQARQDSTAAIANGGGANWAVQHNDYVIGQAIMMAQRDATKNPGTQQAAENQTQSQKSSSSNIRVMSTGKRVQTTSSGKLQK